MDGLSGLFFEWIVRIPARVDEVDHRQIVNTTSSHQNATTGSFVGLLYVARFM